VNISIVLAVQADAIVVPAHAVQTGQKGTYVFVIKPDMTAETRSVKVSRTLDDLTVISEGLSPGELVVTDGHQRVVQGTRVEIKQSTAPKPAS
jgi:multidrug efflux system membrane fusion protein